MSDKEIQRLLDLAQTLLERARTFTKEEALESLIAIGILDEKGEYTKPFQELNQFEE